jgi:2-polyprenyl-3-methyl-5-hydroxy-6-metoxy-1,4-benzoquinol methylase
MDDNNYHSIPLGVEMLTLKLQDVMTPEMSHDSDWYNWHSLSLSGFYMGMENARRTLGPGRFKFLDIGSGIGTKLYLADSLGFEPHGIEHVSQYVDISNAIFPEYSVFCGDLFDFQQYNEFHVIYSYRVARNLTLQEKVNDHIRSNMSPGAVLFLAGNDPAAQRSEVIS